MKERIMGVDTKKCPFCTAEIKLEAIKCGYCGSNLPGPQTGVGASLPPSAAPYPVSPPPYSPTPPSYPQSARPPLVSSPPAPKKSVLGFALIFVALLFASLFALYIINRAEESHKERSQAELAQARKEGEDARIRKEEEAAKRYEATLSRGWDESKTGNYEAAKATFTEAINIPNYVGPKDKAESGVTVCQIALGETVSIEEFLTPQLELVDDDTLASIVNDNSFPLTFTLFSEQVDAKLKEHLPRLAKAEQVRRKEKKADEAKRKKALETEEIEDKVFDATWAKIWDPNRPESVTDKQIFAKVGKQFGISAKQVEDIHDRRIVENQDRFATPGGSMKAELSRLRLGFSEGTIREVKVSNFPTVTAHIDVKALTLTEFAMANDAISILQVAFKNQEIQEVRLGFLGDCPGMGEIFVYTVEADRSTFERVNARITNSSYPPQVMSAFEGGCSMCCQR
jgi:hypothetical protein